MQIIEVKDFSTRLIKLCLSPGGSGMPRRRRDQLIIMQSIILTLNPKQTYSEKAINRGLENWLESIGKSLEVDHVTLRRYLVDEGFLLRDSAGRAYRIDRHAQQNYFAAGVEKLDPQLLIETEEERIRARRNEYQET